MGFRQCISYVILLPAVTCLTEAAEGKKIIWVDVVRGIQSVMMGRHGDIYVTKWPSL